MDFFMWVSPRTLLGFTVSFLPTLCDCQPSPAQRVPRARLRGQRRGFPVGSVDVSAGFEGREFSYMDSGQQRYLFSGPEDSPWS